MTDKTRNIVSIVVGALPGAMVLMSAIMKLSMNPKLVEDMTKGGFGPYLQILGIVEIVSLILFFVPKTKKIGFYLLCSYLGGAFAVELAQGNHFPVSPIVLALFWVSMFIHNKHHFIAHSDNSSK